MRARKHLAHLVAAEPTAVFEFLQIHGDLRRFRLDIGTDHQARRERPGLVGHDRDAAADNAGLLEGLAAHGILDRLTGLHETRQRRIPARRKPRRTPEQAAIAIHRQHDNNRVRARKMLGLAGVADPLPALLGDMGRPATLRAEAVRLMPVQHRLTLRDRAEVSWRGSSVKRQRAQADQQVPSLVFQYLFRFRIDQHRESPGLLVATEKDHFPVSPRKRNFGSGEQRPCRLAVTLQDGVVAAEGVKSCFRRTPERLDDFRPRPHLRRAVKRTMCKAEARRRLHLHQRGKQGFDLCGKTSGRVGHACHP